MHLAPQAFHVSGSVVTLLYGLSGSNEGELFGQPATGKHFEVRVEGDLVFSKHAEGRFPEPGEVLEALEAYAAA